MNATSLNHKTIRPGSLMSYSYYHSARRPIATPKPVSRRPAINRTWRRRAVITVLILAALVVLPILRGSTLPVLSDPTTSSPPTISSSGASAGLAAAAVQSSNQCAGNKLGHFVLVSISQRHLWACNGSKTIYDSPVVTGIETHASTQTPTGTYHVYDKQTNLTLTGSDETGSWSDPVKYWMPFLNNNYGTYGFHDATWRSNNQFGNVDPNSSAASHGCVELPLTTAQWLYSWVDVGTTVTIKS